MDLKVKWYNFMLTMFFWIFISNIISYIFDKLNLSDKYYITANIILFVISIILISNSKTFFYN